jgi:hypothetical protein
VRDLAEPRCRGSDDLHGRAGHRDEPAHREADARDTPPRQTVIGMLNDAKCGDYLKALYWDGSGLCLFASCCSVGSRGIVILLSMRTVEPSSDGRLEMPNFALFRI